jgi:hypothetical protein
MKIDTDKKYRERLFFMQTGGGKVPKICPECGKKTT